MAQNFLDLFKEHLILSTAKAILERGWELTPNDREIVLQEIFSKASTYFNDAQILTSAKVNAGYERFSITTKLLGENGKGAYEACQALVVCSNNNEDNYKKVLQGVEITRNNQVMENFKTLIAQYSASRYHQELMLNFLLAYRKAIYASAEKDYKSPIGPELVTQMKERRQEILELDTNYIKK